MTRTSLHVSIGLVAAATLAIAAMPSLSRADQLVLDEAIRAGGLWCIPSAENPLLFRYLPGDARLARGSDGRPLFSLIYYVEPATGGAGAAATQQGEGGALLTMIVEYETSRGRVSRAQAALHELIDADAVLAGPVVFDEGIYALTSSVGTEARVAFTTGSAPVLEGGKVALSLQFDAAGARRLAAALQAATPDLSVAFDMTYTGVHASYDADILIDWDKASDSLDEGLSLGVSVYGVSIGGEIERAVTTMMSEGAITVEVRGEDASMDAIVSHVQEMATRLFFEPLEEPDAAGDFGDVADVGGALASAGGSANRYFSISAKAKYKRKQIVTTGTTKFSLSKQGPATRRWAIVFDAGEIAASLREDSRYVRTVDLTDNTIVERRVAFQLDAGLPEVFAELADVVTVELRKTHEDGRETFRQLSITRETLEAAEPLELSYPRFEGDDWESWLGYRIRTLWSLRGAPVRETEWRESAEPTVVLAAPFTRTTIYPLGDLAALGERGVRAVVLEVAYDFLDGERSTRKTALTSGAGGDLGPFEILVPRDGPELRYTVTHIYPENRRETFTSVDRAGFVVFDASPRRPTSDERSGR